MRRARRQGPRDEEGPEEPEGAGEAEDSGDEGPAEGGSGTPVIRVWDRPDDDRDPPSQRPEDTYEEARRRRAG